MDILFWTKLNPKIAVGRVNRRFYNQYYYKLEIKIPGTSFLRDSETSLDKQLENRKRVRRSVNFAGSWRMKHLQLPDQRDLEFLARIRDAKPLYETTMKFRIEEPTLHVYSNSEDELYKFAIAVADPTQSTDGFCKIFKPLSDKHLELLEQGYTVKRRESEYPFKVLVREGRYTKERKQQILNYLNNLGDLVELPLHFISSMEKKYDSVWNCYFYSKDRGILTMLSMIDPRFIRDIEEYQTISDK